MTKKLLNRFLFPLVFFLLPLIVRAQDYASMTDEEAAEVAAAGCAACAGMGGVFIAIVVLIFVVNIALLIWVARDAKSRGMDSSVIWMILVMFTSFLGLIIYIFSRPQGQLKQCSSCNNKRLRASSKCPHCGNA